MKPICPVRDGARRASGEARPARARFPRTDYFLQSGLNDWRGYSWSNGDDNPDFRNFHRLNRQARLVNAREYGRELFVFGLMVLAAGWLVVYMVITVIGLLSSGGS